MKKFFLFLLLPLLFLFAHLTYLYLHPTFRAKDFICEFPILENGSSTQVNYTELLPILSQDYTYFGRGKQMSAYLSADGKTIIKFFHPHMPIKRAWFHDWRKIKKLCSLRTFSHLYFNKKNRLQKLFNRYNWGFEELRDEAGLVFVHLAASSAIAQTLKITHSDGKIEEINLLQTPFVLQRKAELALNSLQKWAAVQDREQIIQAAHALKSLLLTRLEKGFTDRIQTLHNNYGFLDGKAIQIDLGRLQKIPPEEQSKERIRLLESLKNSLLPFSSYLPEDFFFK